MGCGGVGKSSVARALAQIINVPYLEAKHVTGEILKRDGYDYSSGVQVERFLAAPSRQMEMLTKTITEQNGTDDFVTDRTFIDLAAYAIAELSDGDEGLLRRIYGACHSQSTIYTDLILCPWYDVPVVNNAKRTLNPWYQFKVHSLLVSLVSEWNLKCLVLKSDNLDERVKEIETHLREKMYD